MRIDTIVNVIDAELVNAGFISEIAGFADSLKDVKDEYLFISDDDEEIAEAIQKGAYAILSTEYHNIIDDEIAWLRVDDIEESVFRLQKYKLLNKTLYFCNKITYQVIDSINRDNRVIVFEKPTIECLNEHEFYVTSNEEFKLISNVNLENKVKLKLLDSTLFTTKFMYDKEYKLIFPGLYLDKLEEGLEFFETFKLKYCLKDLKIDRFRPTFVNKKNEIVKFGLTNRVVISGIKNDEFLIKDLNFIFQKAKYANVKFYNQDNIDFFYKDNYNFAILIDVEVALKEKEELQEKLL
jgi:hypothetical protein